MNAFELYDAVFDSANSYAPSEEATAEEIAIAAKKYAEGAFDLYISDEAAEAIAKAHIEHQAFCAGGKASTSDFYYMVESPLSEIEL